MSEKPVKKIEEKEKENKYTNPGQWIGNKEPTVRLDTKGKENAESNILRSSNT